jgi:glycerol-3-phosphate O-acyltransferase / dihydroxyacetone phosphate acyltransferase
VTRSASKTVINVCRSLRPLIIALLPGQQRSLNRLKAMREEISIEVNAVIDEFGPQLYDDFDSVRPLAWVNLKEN